MIITSRCSPNHCVYLLDLQKNKRDWHPFKSKTLRPPNWPAKSPDLGLIEALWGDMGAELGQTWGRVNDLKALEGAIGV